MKIHLLLPRRLSPLVAACSSGSGPDVPDHAVQAFDRLHMKMYADTNKPITDRPITITTEVTPLVSGKGRIAMSVSMSNMEMVWEFLSPVQRAIDLPSQAADTLSSTLSKCEIRLVKSNG
ncbi:MAG TPA: hypothetical protein VHC20_06380 [Candidatus Paceibacterota bacterium]|nr:hypothetical protein [Candidatus Paceibacterota bacterium]